MYFVSGITGKVGGAAARRLLGQGQELRALVRDLRKAAAWSHQGVDLRQGDLTDANALAEALEGVEGAFLMQPTPIGVTREFPEAKALIAGITEVLRRAQPPRLVVLSSVGSERSSGLGNITQTCMLEQALADYAQPLAFVRAGAFIENNLHAMQRAESTGFFDSFLQPTDRSFPMAATADIGAQVADLLMAGWDGRKVVELGSRVTPNELAVAMSKVLKRPVQARPIPRDQWSETLAAMGLPDDKAANWEEMQDGFNSGWIDFGRPGTEPVAGTTKPAQVFAQVRQG